MGRTQDVGRGVHSQGVRDGQLDEYPWVLDLGTAAMYQCQCTETYGVTNGTYGWLEHQDRVHWSQYHKDICNPLG